MTDAQIKALAEQARIHLAQIQEISDTLHKQGVFIKITTEFTTLDYFHPHLNPMRDGELLMEKVKTAPRFGFEATQKKAF